MTRLNLAILSLVLSTGALAQERPLAWNKTRIVPPIEYDYPFPGDLRIARVDSEAAVRIACAGADFKSGYAMACNYRWGWHRCDVFIAADEVLATVGLTYEVALRHEIGHCNGWPGDHHGARYLEPNGELPAQVMPLRQNQFPAWLDERFFFPAR